MSSDGLIWKLKTWFGDNCFLHTFKPKAPMIVLKAVPKHIAFSDEMAS